MIPVPLTRPSEHPGRPGLVTPLLSKLNERGGVLPVDKPAGPTSHDIVAAARRALRLRRIGHTGTLDPFASGLLLLCLGPATRLAEYLTGLDKGYLATMRLGERTDTGDLTGNTVAASEGWRDLSRSAVEAVLAALRGTQLQSPPVFSAKKIRGQRSYELARRGEAIQPEPVEVTIHELELLEFELPLVRFRARCSSGTYIRAIARDAGEALGPGAHLTELRRTAIGTHRVEGAVPVAALADMEAVAQALLAPLSALAHLPRVGGLERADLAALSHGRPVPIPPGVGHEPMAAVAVHDAGGDLVAITSSDGELLRPGKVFQPALVV